MNRNFASSTLSTDLVDSNLSLLEQSPLQSSLQRAVASQSSSQATNSADFDGSGGRKLFKIPRGNGNTTIDNFGGIGARGKQTDAIIANLDTLKFEGAGLTAKNMVLTQQGKDLIVSFERVSNTQVTLKNFQLENLDNLPVGSALLGNILFEGDSTIQDSFDLFDANWQRSQILEGQQSSRVTFLNDLDNRIAGFDRFNDTINGQGGSDIIYGLGGDDVLRGDAGNDLLWGDVGNDTLWGGLGRDALVGGSGRDIFVLEPNKGEDTIIDFKLSERDRIGLAGGLTFDQLIITQGTGNNANNTLISTQTSGLLATLNNISASTLSNAAFLTLGNFGLVTSQGDRAMQADVARSRFGVDGTGIKIGVLSNNFNRLGGAVGDIASGDLPTRVTVLADDLSSEISRVTDEGRAMMQLIHDVAPGASLMFHTGVASQKVFADGIRALAAQGAQIIVDDITLAEPMFQDGIVAQAIEEVVKQGIPYFAAARNNARDSYQSAFRSAEFFAGYGEVHDFDPGSGVDFYQSITLAKNDSFDLSFQWDSPLGRSTNDLDIYLLDNAKQKVLASSRLSNVGGDPIEALTFRNDGSFGSDQFNLLIAKRSGAAPGLMKYVVNDAANTFTINDYNTNSSTIYGNGNARGVAAVGAAAYFNTPAYGVNPARLQNFSSAGGTPILFDQKGDRLSRPEFRRQPRFVGPDDTNTTFFGTDIVEDADLFPNFRGTSAAAPHLAAVAALMLQANRSLSPAQINQVLEQTALDMDDPITPGFDVGFDNASGYGLVQVDRAIAQLV
ncbi:S8 family serine peptidase [Phormidesmis sp. 146-35]